MDFTIYIVSKMSALEIAGVSISILGLVVACCTPCITAGANLLLFAGFRMIKMYLSPRAPPAAISTDSALVCHFQPPEGV